MKAVISQAVGSQLIQRRHPARAAECARLSEPDIVEQNDDDVRRSFRGFHFKARRRFGITSVKFRDGWRLRLGDRKHGPINLLRRQRQRQQAQRSDQQMDHWRILHDDFGFHCDWIVPFSFSYSLKMPDHGSSRSRCHVVPPGGRNFGAPDVIFYRTLGLSRDQLWRPILHGSYSDNASSGTPSHLAAAARSVNKATWSGE